MDRFHATTKVLSVTYNQLSPDDEAKIREAARILKIKPQDITSHTQVATETHGTFKVPIDIAGDFKFDDGHLTLKGQDTSGQIEGIYIYKDTSNITLYKQPKKILGIKMGIFGNNDYLDVSFGNPNTNITGLTNIDLKKYSPPKACGIGLQVGYTYITGAFRPYVGVGLSFNLIRF